MLLLVLLLLLFLFVFALPCLTLPCLPTCQPALPRKKKQNKNKKLKKKKMSDGPAKPTGLRVYGGAHPNRYQTAKLGKRKTLFSFCCDWSSEREIKWENRAIAPPRFFRSNIYTVSHFWSAVLGLMQCGHTHTHTKRERER